MAQSFEIAYQTSLSGQSGGPLPETRPLLQIQQPYSQSVGFPQNTLPPPLFNGQPVPCAPTPDSGPYTGLEIQSRRPVPSGELNTSTSVDSVRSSGLQSDHTTPAHMLLEEWPLMRPFIVGVDYLNELKENGRKASDYPVWLEQNRGLLRIWGVGEEPGNPEGSTYSNVSSPAPRKDDHPLSDQSDSSTINGNLYQESTRFEGGLGLDGRPNFEAQVLWQLHGSYMQNMHSLHPFLDPRKIYIMIEEFSEQANAMPIPGRPGIKRERSTSHFGEPCFLGGAIERSLRNAIVLLILALGKVCLYKGKVLPAPQDASSATAKRARGYTQDFPRHNAGFDHESSEDRPSNIEVLPGMAYFAYATDILGYQHSGNTAAHAQAMILATLYLNQYSRVLESWSWIERACSITKLLIKPDYNELRRDTYLDIKASLSSSERYRLKLIMRICWTCMQLGSDIRAELATLPASSASGYQNDIMYPEGFFEEEETSMMIISLRVILNESHNALYGNSGRKSFDVSNLREVANYARSHVDMLESWRKLLPLGLAWKDDDPPATDLKIARLRAKYYGGLYMILRPYLRIAIHTFTPLPQQNLLAATADLAEDQRQVIETACQCIDAAIRSTIAFDRVGANPDSSYEEFQSTRTERLVVTNIFGTLHAQFGNIIVLTAVARSPLHQYLPSSTKLTKSNLAALITRTISVLSECAPNSPILKMDLEILENVRRQQKSSR
ncbi:hypothetical protein GQ44DRAFT_832052 [Phaeosphaeriaceae sp. PMI808]|nr:hypothetical protein GQ44DRAFT_832052 [Phaeosphaeriaceae sp. PMI808]